MHASPNEVLPRPSLPIALIGLRGSGKSSVGRELARLLELDFVDLDEELARTHGAREAGEVLAELGEPAFRELEALVLDRVLARGGGQVLATGGGLVEWPSNRERLEHETIAVWLEARPEELLRRLSGDPAKRPKLVAGERRDEIETLGQRRAPWYAEIARLRLRAEGLPTEIASEIQRRLAGIGSGVAPMLERSMNIAILLLNRGRGSGEVAREHARYLMKAGHRVHFAHHGIGDGVEGAINHDVPLRGPSVPVHEYLPSAGERQRPVPKMSSDEACAYLVDYERVLEQIIDDVDIVIGHHASLPAIAAQRVARSRGKPYVLFLHGTGIEPRHHAGYDDRLWAEIQGSIEDADGLLVTTEYVRDELVRPLVDVDAERFLILPCGVDLERFRPDAAGDVAAEYGLPETYVICPGALIAAKGPQNVVAASEVYADLAPTIFIGDGELRAELERQLGDRGRFLGYVPVEDKVRLISGASVLTAAPEKKEHFGIIYVEALAGGTVPVAYRGGGVDSVITPDVGLLTERDPVALGSAVREILLDDARRHELAANGRLRAEASYAYPRLVEQLVAWLRSFCVHGRSKLVGE